MKNGRTPKDILYGELVSENKTTGHRKLWYKDVCESDTQALDLH